jgi:hypothetical protein
VFTEDTFKVYSCKTCGFEWIANKFNPQEISVYYGEGYGASMHEKRDSLTVKMQEVLIGMELRDILKKCSKNDLILDWGAGPGNVSNYLSKKGYNVEAVDLYSKENWKLGNVPYTSIDLNSVDTDSIIESLKSKNIKAVILRHTLEHFLDPRKMVELFKKLEIEFVLIIVPNHNSWLRSLFGQSWCYWDPPRHLSFFTERSLDVLLKQTGYQTLKSRKYGLDEIYNSLVRFLYLRGIRTLHFNTFLSSASSALAYPFFNTVLSNLSQIEKK